MPLTIRSLHMASPRASDPGHRRSARAAAVPRSPPWGTCVTIVRRHAPENPPPRRKQLRTRTHDPFFSQVMVLSMIIRAISFVQKFDFGLSSPGVRPLRAALAARTRGTPWPHHPSPTQRARKAAADGRRFRPPAHRLRGVDAPRHRTAPRTGAARSRTGHGHARADRPRRPLRRRQARRRLPPGRHPPRPGRRTGRGRPRRRAGGGPGPRPARLGLAVPAGQRRTRRRRARGARPVPHDAGRHAEGLVVLVGPDSDVGLAAGRNHMQRARRCLERWRETAETAVELVDHYGPGQHRRASAMLHLAEQTRTLAVLGNAVRYPRRDGAAPARVLDEARRWLPGGQPPPEADTSQAYVKSTPEMRAVAERICGPDPAAAARLLAHTRAL